MLDGSCIANAVECYNVAHVTLGPHALVSQRAHLCTASHDFEDCSFQLVGAPILIEADAWVAAEVFVGPGVTLRRGSVALARTVVVKDVPEWTVVAGNPARRIRMRKSPFENSV
jgi:putative colanic acid biosynthesis acetyltransferase WcaF